MSKITKGPIWTTHHFGYGVKDLRFLRWWWMVLLWTSVTIAVFVGAFTGGILWAETICTNKAEVLEVEYRFKVLGGCFYEINDEWIPARNYRGIVTLD